MAFVLYVAVKLISYIAWCWLALLLWRPGSAGFIRATGFGLLRLAIGVAFGITIYFMGSIEPEDVIWKYIAIYAPVRMVEWSGLAFLIARGAAVKRALSSVLWCLGGIVVSFVADFASPEGVAGTSV
jgi:hypothetical protein